MRRSGSALLIAVASCLSLASCRFELAADAGTFAPSVGEVRSLLDQGRVRLALAHADSLARQYWGPEAELVHGWALWRNGRARDAETHFRRAADAGAAEGLAGLAAVRASTGEWSEAIELARGALAGGELVGAARAVLASAAWVAGDGAAAARELQAWSAAEPGTARGRAAAAMAAAASRLGGAPDEWVGEVVSVPVQRTADGGWAAQATINGTPARLRLDLAFRQSLISGRLATSLGVAVDGQAGATGRGPTARWPAMLAPRQAGLESIDFGALSVRRVVVGVADVPADVDGVLGADLLSTVRWSLLFDRGELVMAPPSVGSTALPGGREGSAIAWMKARLVREGIGAQLLLYPRVDGSVVAAGIDLAAASRLDQVSFVVPPGSNSAPRTLMLGGWRGEAQWRPASLTGWAVDGGVAPVAVLGSNVLVPWSLHWYPESMQLRIDEPPLQ